VEAYDHRETVLLFASQPAWRNAPEVPLGVLKGSSDPISLTALLGLAVALVPLGVAVLRDGPAPRWRAVALAVAFIPVAFLLGMSG
jgi:hypothetical protein